MLEGAGGEYPHLRVDAEDVAARLFYAGFQAAAPCWPPAAPRSLGCARDDSLNWLCKSRGSLRSLV